MKTKIKEEDKFISMKEISLMTIPLIIEQFLEMIVSIADSTIASYAGQNVISGISLDTAIYAVFIFLFSSIGLGGSIIISQYIGKKNYEKACYTAGQTFFISLVFSLFCTTGIYFFSDKLLDLLYKSVDSNIMSVSRLYLKIVSFSFPFIAIYNAGASVYKSIGKTKTIMIISFIANVFNIIGDLFSVFVLKIGEYGIAWATTLTWAISALSITILCFKKNNIVHISKKNIFRPDFKILQKLAGISIPNIMENGLFQVSKLILASFIATFGATQIAANGVDQAIWNLTAITGIAIGPIYVTIIGKAVGAGNKDLAKYYMKWLTIYTYVLFIIWNIIITLLLKPYLSWVNVDDSVKKLVISTTILHNVFIALVSPVAQTVPNGFKAAGDLKFPLLSSVICTCFIRVISTYFFGIYLGMGLMGYVIAMCFDWTVKAIMVIFRYLSNNWMKEKII